MSEPAPPSGTSQTSGGVSDNEGAVRRLDDGGDTGDGNTSAASGAVSRTSAGTSNTGVTSGASTTTISTIAVQSGNTRIVLALLQSGEWLELRVVELSPGLVYLGSTLEEASALQQAHHEVLTKLQSKQSPVEDLLNQADQLISTQKPRAEVYAAMAESLGLAWRDLNSHLETRKTLLDMSVAFHTRARQYSNALDAAEKIYTDNVMPSDAEGARQLLTALHDHKRNILESSMFTLQEAHIILSRLRGLLQEGGTMDSRPQHIKINIEFACSQIEHYLESLHDRRRFLDGLFMTRKHHLEQCLALCLLYQDLTEAIMNLKKLRDDISANQDLGASQANSEILLHEHLRRESTSKAQQDQCVRHVRTAEQMVESGHYAGAEARARAYSVLEAATALHETCDTRTALLQQAALFFRLANAALTKLDQAEVQVAGLNAKGGNQRLSIVMGVVEEAIQPALAEGYALLEVTGGRGQTHNEGITDMVEQLENRRTRLSSLCASSTEEVLQRTELINSFLEMYNSIESWLVRIGDSFLQGHQDPGGSVSLAKDFLHLHLTLRSDLIDKNQEINSLSSFLDQLSQELSEEELSEYRDKVDGVRNHWNNLEDILDSRIKLSERYVKFHEDAELIQLEFEGLENQLKAAASEADNRIIDEKWRKIQNMFLNLDASGKKFIQMANESEYPYLDINRAILSVESILESLAKRKLVITDLHSHYQMKISINKELTVLWNTYKENLKKMETEMQNLEDCFCPLLRGDSSDPEGMGSSLETRLIAYVKAIKLIQEDIENMVTKAEGMSYSDNLGAERPEILRALLQLYQNLQNKTTDYQILGTMLIQWCKNIAEVHRSCDKLEKQFGVVYIDPGSVEGQLREHEASKHAVFELLKFAQHEADAIVQKIRVQCPREPGSKDIARIKDMLQRRKKIMEENWTERQTLLERQLKRSHYQVDLKLISDQLRDLSDQLTRMQGHFGDSLNTALNMRTAFNQFKLTVELLERRIQNFVSTAEKMLKADDDSRDIQLEIAELQKKWSTFHMQVGDSQKSIELSIKFFKLVQEAEDWFKDGSQLLITVAGESSQIKNPDQALKLRQRIESFLTPGQQVQANRINQISSLSIQLYGDSTPQQQLQVEAVSQQNQYMLESFNVINKNLTELLDNLREAEEQRYKQEKEQQELAASLALAQAEAEAARLAAEAARLAAAAAAEEARRVAEEAAKAMAARKIISESQKVEVVVQTESFTSHEEQEPAIEEPQHLPPMFLTPLLGATVTEGVKFTFECRVTGLPKPDVIWLKDGLSIMSNPDYGTSFDGEVCTLTIEETFTEDSAVFTCRAVNLVGTAESSANLIVKESAPTEIMSPPSFVKRLVDSTGQEGSSFQLEATVTGHPLPVVSWTKNGNCIDNSPDYIITFNNGECILRFEELFLEDEAEYVCKASNDIGEDLTKAKLSVKATVASEKPSFPVPLSNLMARAGQKFKLECQVNGSPTPSLAWFHNSKPVKETSECKITFDGKVASLVISEAFPKNAGCYALVAKNTAGEAQTSSNVSVKGRIPTETSDSELASDIDAEPIKPSVQQPLKDIVTTEGQAIRLDCIIVGQPEPEVIWYHDEKPVKESEDFRLLFHGDRCSLVIQEAFLEDAGMYKVVAMNSAGETSTSCSVAIQAAPEKVPSPLPPPELITATLVPPTVAPRFSELLGDTHVIEGQPVTLTACAHGSPKPTIAWFRDRVPLLPDDQLQMWEEPEGFVKVYIPCSTPLHTGQYEVVASNSVGTAKCIAFLSVELRLPTPPPEEPKEPPVFTKLLQDVAKKSGDSVLLEAEVTGKPKPSVSYCFGSSKGGILSCAIGLQENDLEMNKALGKNIEKEMKQNFILLDSELSESANSDEQDTLGSSFRGYNKPSICRNVLKRETPLLESYKFNLDDKRIYISSINQEIERIVSESDEEELSVNVSNHMKNVEVWNHETYNKFLLQTLMNDSKIDFEEVDEKELSDLSFERHENEKENSPDIDIENDVKPKDVSHIIETGVANYVQPVKLEDLWKVIHRQHIMLNNNCSDNILESPAKEDLKGSEDGHESGYYSGKFLLACDETDILDINENGIKLSNSFQLNEKEIHTNTIASTASNDNNARESTTTSVKLEEASSSSSEDIRTMVFETKIFHNSKGNDIDDFVEIDDKPKQSKTVKISKERITETEENKNKFETNVEGNTKISKRGKKKKKISDTADLLHLLFDEKYEDAYISQVLDEGCMADVRKTKKLDVRKSTSNGTSSLVGKNGSNRGNLNVSDSKLLYPMDNHNLPSRSTSPLSVISEEETSSEWERNDSDFTETKNSDNDTEGDMRYCISISPSKNNGFVELKPNREMEIFERISDTKPSKPRRSKEHLNNLKKITQMLKTPSKISNNKNYFDASNVSPNDIPNSFNFMTITPYRCYPLKLKKANSLVLFNPSSIQEHFSEETFTSSSMDQSILISDGVFFFVLKIMTKISLEEMKGRIIERLSSTFETGRQVLHTYIMPLSNTDNCNNSPPTQLLGITAESLKNCLHHFVYKTCELATSPQAAILNEELADPTTPAIVHAGYFLIYVLCYKDEERKL